MIYEGVLPVNKPAGFTSHDVVAKMRRILKMKRIGHTGTLDPQVTGVLPLCLGRATRFVEYIQELPKEYEAELTIGYATDTEDWTGETVQSLEPGSVRLEEDRVRVALASFVGTIDQVPPMYSAVKVGGKKLYELAREGKEIERKSRKVDIYELEPLKLELELDAGYPKIRFRVLCSKGTYIRTLCVDIGKALGYPAVMTDLVRSSTGSIALDRCLRIEQIEELHRLGRLHEAILPADRLVTHIPSVEITGRDALHAMQGKTIRAESGLPADGGLVRVYDDQGTFIGLFRADSRSGTLRPEKVFAQAEPRPDA
ncbi:tRNA pseudouridine(55) synthase TruB [Paenibacillus flagellatus]|uniref:tRNA pseudouridine synthase B n=1 Tax=Paenibacillus flagellatus TaxID=2211139 RepID=A0A2V5JUQ1_9BACL|nr:tRNA pseudouridine(55) synthase TruB [Paenibacillus flagellatus]PYI50415.1 tRNA pseudouridine(55) synthase TruB [Paenibacillus flagellatus]